MNRKPPLIFLALLAGAGYYFLLRKTPAQKRAALVADATAKGDTGSAAVYNRMTDAEIETMYTFYFDYLKKGLPQPASTTQLGQQLNAILIKYST